MKKKLSVLLSILTAAAMLAGCSAQETPAEQDAPAPQEPVQFAESADINSVHLRDMDALYLAEDPYDVVTMYLTVREGNASDGTDHTWQEVNTYSAYYYNDRGIDRYRVAGLLQVGDENGPVEGKLGYGETLPNATVQIRGQTSSRYSQKNYKIELLDTGNREWNGQRTIAVNKHMSEGMRFRNKMAYDLMAEIPQIMSLRTQFVHLYVRDMTGSEPDVFRDYGIFTQVEQLNKSALRAHGLDKNGYLYKINSCEFYEYEDLRLVSDPLYNEAAFSAIMETKGRDDHTRLLQMIHAVNDMSVTPDELLDTYFDRENIAYWMAFMILMGNPDTQNRNFYLYSPLNGEKWYIYPWDNDDMLTATEWEVRNFANSVEWQNGISNYWGNMLFRRALMSQQFKEELDSAVNDLLENHLTAEHLQEMAEGYSATVRPYLERMPDLNYLPVTFEEYDLIKNALPHEVKDNYERYKASLLSPMPFFVGEPVQEGNTLKLVWESAYQPDDQDVTYHVKLARDPYYQTILFEQDNLKLPQTTCSLTLTPGQYFVGVEATNEAGYTTTCFDYYVGINGKVPNAYGFFVNEDGTIDAYTNDEGDE